MILIASLLHVVMRSFCGVQCGAVKAQCACAPSLNFAIRHTKKSKYMKDICDSAHIVWHDNLYN